MNAVATAVCHRIRVVEMCYFLYVATIPNALSSLTLLFLYRPLMLLYDLKVSEVNHEDDRVWQKLGQNGSSDIECGHPKVSPA